MLYLELLHLAVTAYLIWIVWRLGNLTHQDWLAQVSINDRLITLLDSLIPTQHKMWEELRRLNHNRSGIDPH